MLAGVVAAAIPVSPPRRAVAIFFLGVDGMAQPVIDIRFPPLAQNDPPAAQRRQRQQRQSVRNHTPTLRTGHSGLAASSPTTAAATPRAASAERPVRHNRIKITSEQLAACQGPAGFTPSR
jgi:hypothetical protein